MEMSSKGQYEREKISNWNSNSSPMNSPRSNYQIPTSPLTPKHIPRSDSNPYPTTFVQADTSSFKQVVQMLTGSSDSPRDPNPNSSSKTFNIPPVKMTPKKQGFKLYERRNNHLKNTLIINTLVPNFAPNSSSAFSPRKPEILSPSVLDFPSLTLSPVTPLDDRDNGGVDHFGKSSPLLTTSSLSSSSASASEEEEKAIAEKGYYLHPSPLTTPRDSEPRLLPLFPLLDEPLKKEILGYNSFLVKEEFW
ncbi:VQ motif-containing protein 4 [Senna tora]|uniref:VQ motif-containing protein 4 n=1 Tax=Senna tora TaxID=362788 RepID=A0A835CBC1_9FABA|nr:VQ motif-containing protein 4 [Senna tora]